VEKSKTYKNPKYLEYIRTLPCCVCRRGAEPHHADTGGVGIKCSDTRAIPLCHRCHVECHAIGRNTFQEKNNIDFKTVQVKCLEEFIAVRMGG
jgi:hypothetical protein